MATKSKSLIKAIRDCRSPQEEDEVAAKEFSSIRNCLWSSTLKTASSIVTDLVYLNTLGYPSEIGRMECMKLMASSDINSKRIGYMGCSQLLDHNLEILTLCINSVKSDLRSGVPVVVSMALIFMSSMGTTDMFAVLNDEIRRIMTSKIESSHHRKLCCLSISKMFRSVAPQDMDYPLFVDMVIELITKCEQNYKALDDESPSEMISGIRALIDGLKKGSPMSDCIRERKPQLIRPLISTLEHSVKTLEMESDGVHLQLAILRIIKVLGVEQRDLDLIVGLSNTLTRLIVTQQRSSKSTLTYECIQTITSLREHLDPKLTGLVINEVQSLLDRRDPNLRYGGLKCLSEFKEVMPSHTSQLRRAMKACLDDRDISVARRALGVFASFVSQETAIDALDELFDTLRWSTKIHSDIVRNALNILRAFKFPPGYHFSAFLRVLILIGNTPSSNSETVRKVFDVVGIADNSSLGNVSVADTLVYRFLDYRTTDRNVEDPFFFNLFEKIVHSLRIDCLNDGQLATISTLMRIIGIQVFYLSDREENQLGGAIERDSILSLCIELPVYVTEFLKKMETSGPIDQRSCISTRILLDALSLFGRMGTWLTEGSRKHIESHQCDKLSSRLFILLHLIEKLGMSDPEVVRRARHTRNLIDFLKSAKYEERNIAMDAIRPPPSEKVILGKRGHGTRIENKERESIMTDVDIVFAGIEYQPRGLRDTRNTSKESISKAVETLAASSILNSHDYTSKESSQFISNSFERRSTSDVLDLDKNDYKVKKEKQSLVATSTKRVEEKIQDLVETAFDFDSAINPRYHNRERDSLISTESISNQKSISVEHFSRPDLKSHSTIDNSDSIDLFSFSTHETLSIPTSVSYSVGIRLPEEGVNAVPGSVSYVENDLAGMSLFHTDNESMATVNVRLSNSTAEMGSTQPASNQSSHSTKRSLDYGNGTERSTYSFDSILLSSPATRPDTDFCRCIDFGVLKGYFSYASSSTGSIYETDNLTRATRIQAKFSNDGTCIIENIKLEFSVLKNMRLHVDKSSKTRLEPREFLIQEFTVFTQSSKVLFRIRATFMHQNSLITNTATVEMPDRNDTKNSG